MRSDVPTRFSHTERERPGRHEETLSLLGGGGQGDTSKGRTGGKDASKRTGTFYGSVVNLANAAIGAGVLAFPSGFSFAGILQGPILAFVFYVFVCVSLHIIGKAQDESNAVTYQSLVRATLGRGAEYLTIAAQLFFLVGSSIAYLDIVADHIIPEVEHLSFLSWASPLMIRVVVIGVEGFCVCLPLCFIDNIQRLAPMATFSMVAITYTLGVILVLGVTQLQAHGLPASHHAANTSLFSLELLAQAGPGYSAAAPNHTNHTVTAAPSAAPAPPAPSGNGLNFGEDKALGVFNALPIIAFAFLAHPTFPLVYAEMAVPASFGMRSGELTDRIKALMLKRMDWAVGVAFGTCLLIYVACGAMGQLYCISKGVPVPDDILLAYPNSIAVRLARFGIAISVTSSYVSFHFAAKKCFEDVAAALSGAGGGNGSLRNTVQDGAAWTPPPTKAFGARAAALERVVFVLCTSTVAVFVSSIDVVLGFVGATACVAQMLIIPGMLAIKGVPAGGCWKMLGWAMVLGGTGVGGISLFVAFQKAAGH